MSKLLFNDRMTIKTVENGKTSDYVCEFHKKYVDAAKNLRDKEEWKHSGSGASFRGDEYDYAVSEETDNSYFDSLDFFDGKDDIIFSVTVNEVSGVMRKDLTAECDGESHIVHSRENVFAGATPNAEKSKFVTCVKNGYINSHLAVYDLKNNDYYTLTDGDCADFDAVFSVRDDNAILFASKGAGRDRDGHFVKYSNSSLYRYDTLSGDMEEILSDKERSLTKPKDDADGNLYFIRKPETEEKRSAWKILLDIILIPWRLLVAIYRFLETFTLVFTGRKFIKDGSSPVKTKDRDGGKLFIEGNLINAEEEYKRNLRHKDAYAGFAPHSWELVKRDKDGNETTVAKSVIDYCLGENGDVYYVNGKHVLKVSSDGKREKIADASLCTKIACSV